MKSKDNMSMAILEAIEDKEYEEYMAREKEAADRHYKTLCDEITDERRAKFDELKAMINAEAVGCENYDGFCIPTDFIYAVTDSGKGHHLNPYMDLTVSNIYFMIEENNTIEEALKSLFDEYKADSAWSWGDNFLYALDRANPNAYNEMQEPDEEYEDLNESSTYDSVEAAVMKNVYSALSGIDGVKAIENLSGAPLGSNNMDSKSSIKFELDGRTYIVNIMEIDGDINYLN